MLHEDAADRIASLRSIREEAAKDGAKVVFFTGSCRIVVRTKNGKAKLRSVEGVYDEGSGTFYIKVDGRRSAEQVFRREAWHKRVAEDRGVLLDAVKLLEQVYTKEGLDRLVDRYCEAYCGVHGVISEGMIQRERDAIFQAYAEELCADAYTQLRQVGTDTAKAEHVMGNYDQTAAYQGSLLAWRGRGIDSNGGTGYTENGTASGAETGLRSIMERMSRDEFVPEEEIITSPEIRDAKARSDAALQHPTIEDNSAERQALRDDCTLALLELGSAQYDADGRIVKGADGETAYGGTVEQGHHIDIVIGSPAAGKSSVLVDPLSAQHHARVIDNDMAKAMLPEFDNGIGAGAVHEESKVISDFARDLAMEAGDNIVLPIVGGNYGKLVAQIEQFRALGYEVAVHLCDLPANKAIGRAIGRYLNTGRYIPMNILYGYGNTPKENFYRLVQEGIVNEYSEYSNDVGYGEAPKQIRQSSADSGGTGDQRQSGRGVAQDVRRSGRSSDAGASGESSQDARTDARYQRERNAESAGVQGEVHRKAEGEGSEQSSVGAARSGFDPFSHAAIEYGTIEPGENPARVVDVPRSMDGESRVSTAAAHIMESRLVPDSRLNTVQDLIVSGELSDNVRSLDKLSSDAKELVERDIPASLVGFVQQVERGNVSEALVAQGAHLLSVAGDSDMTAAQYAQLYTAMVDLMRNTGRALQAARLVKQLTPEGRMLCLQQAIQNINDRRVETALRKAAQRPGRDGKETAQIVVPEEMWQAYREATTDKARDAVISDIQKYVADQIPSTLYDKWTALRYLNMLGNFKTQVRNVVSNTGAALLYTAKNRVKALVEAPIYGISKVANRASGGKYAEYERTSPLTPASIADPKLYGQAWQDYKQFESEILGDTKFKENLRGQYAREIEAKRQIWKLNGQWGTKEDSNAAAKAIRKSAEAGMALLRGYDKVTSFAMEQGDAIFGRFAYAQALSGYLRANGVKSSTFENVDAELMNRARAYAIQQAQEATFRDTNAVSTFASSFDRNWGRARVFSRGALAFRKTPANIGVRIEQFSPLGVLNTFADIIGKTSGFDISGNDIVEAAAKTLTGTGLLYAGFLAAANGLIRGAGGDDDKEKTLDELAGKQDYSIKIGGKWYDISWLAPSSVPFLIGANIFDVSERNNDPSFIETMLYITDPMIKTSMLSGLNDAIDTIKWSDSPLTDMVITNVFGYLTQGLSNSLIRQAEQAANKETTYTYIDEESWMPDIMQRVLGKWSQGIPGWDYNQAVMVDELGRTVEKGGTAERIFNAFFNPAYYSEEAQNPVVDELQYLYELTQSDPTLSEINVVPSWGNKSYSYKDESGKKITVRFTAEQYEKYSITRGTAITAMLTDLFKSQTYNEMTDEEKAKAVQSVIKTATLYAKAESRTGYVYQKGENKLLDLAFDAKLPASEVFQAKAYRDDLNEMDASANVKMAHFDNYVSHKGWTDAQKKAVLEAYGKFTTHIPAETGKYDKLKESVSSDTALTIIAGVAELAPEDGKESVSALQKWEYVVSVNGLTGAQQDAALRAYMTEEQQSKYEPVAAAGVSAKTYVATTRKITDLQPIRDNTKVSDVQKWQVCIAATKSQEQQDALLRSYMDKEQIAKYNELRKAGVSPATYVAYADAKYTYGDRNGSWKQDELREWLNNQDLAREQKAAIWETTNSGWKTNPYR